MIKLEKIDKYYHKAKNNELHVINNLSLELPNVGLITILGRSGSGKSTLLNIIGGLDKANGKITYDDMVMYNYDMKQIDAYRRQHISYIFQNYLLIEKLSVYDNLKVTLEFMGIFDEEEQKKRIEYVLTSVGLYKYRKKHADKLSGGQMQRVAIARALLKNNRIIIADEPTGNLDSENSLEVMNILKSISKNTLVLLVTHNKNLAEFYSDRIIEMTDGTITKDYSNDGEKSLLHQSDQKIHLLDYDKLTIDNEKIKLNLYTNNDDLVELNVILKNDTLYIESKNKIKIVDGVDVEIKNDHYQELKRDTFSENTYDTSWYKNEKGHNYKFFRYLKQAIIGFFHSSRKEKIFHMIFIIIGVIMAFCTISFVNYTQVDDEDFSTQKNVFILTNSYNDYYSNVKKSTIIKAIDDEIITDVYYYFEESCVLRYYINSHRVQDITYSGYYYPLSIADEIMIGVKPQKSEVVIGRELADRIIKEIDNDITYEELLGCMIDGGYYNNLKIVGITKSSNSIYVADDFYYGTLLYFNNYSAELAEIYFADIKNLQGYNGIMPKENEVVAGNNYRVSQLVNGYKVIATSNLIFNDCLYTTNKTRLKYYVEMFNDLYNPALSFAVTENAHTYFAEQNYLLDTPYNIAYQYTSSMQRQARITNIIFITCLFGFSVIYIYFSTRSKMINQIKTIGVYRSIGATRLQISQVYLANTIVHTSFTSVVGYVVVCSIYSYLAIKLEELGGAILFNTKFAPVYLFIGLIIMYILHLFFGLLPVWLLMKKSPAEINSKYDI